MYDYENFSRQIGENITFLRELNDISKATLAKALDITPASICNYENGNAMILKIFFKICSYFGVTPQAMMSNMSRGFYDKNLHKYAGEYYLYYFDNKFKEDNIEDNTKIKNATLHMAPSNNPKFLSAKLTTDSGEYIGKFKLLENQFTICVSDSYTTMTVCGLPVTLKKHNYIGGLTLTLSVCHGREHRPIFYKQLMSKYPLNDKEAISKFLLIDGTNQSVRLKRSQDNEVYHHIKNVKENNK